MHPRPILLAAALSGAVAWVAASAPAGAQAGPDEPGGEAAWAPESTIRAVVTAPAGCPGSAEIEAEIRARTPLARSASSGEPEWVFNIEIEPDGEAFVGRMTVDHQGERSAERVLRGGRCDALASALALSAALTLDPNARLVVEREPEPPPKPPPAPPPKPASPPPPPPPPPPVEEPVATVHRLGARAGVASLLTPRLMPMAGVFYELGWERSGLLAPSVRVSVSTAFNQVDAERAADFVWVAAGLDLCPLRVPLASALVLRPCAAGQAGALWGRGVFAAEPATALRPWWSGGVSTHLTLGVSSHFAVDLSGAALVPFERREFVIDSPRDEIARTAPMSVIVGLGMSFALP